MNCCFIQNYYLLIIKRSIDRIVIFLCITYLVMILLDSLNISILIFLSLKIIIYHFCLIFLSYSLIYLILIFKENLFLFSQMLPKINKKIKRIVQINNLIMMMMILLKKIKMINLKMLTMILLKIIMIIIIKKGKIRKVKIVLITIVRVVMMKLK